MPKTREERNRSIKKKEVLVDLLVSGLTGLCMFPRNEESNQCAMASNEGRGARSERQGGKMWRRGRWGTNRIQRVKDQTQKATQGPGRRIELGRQVQRG